jgi:putative membrane protein
MTSATAAPRHNDRPFFAFNAVVSAAALSFLFWLLVLREASPDGGLNLRFMPAVNAVFNSISTLLLAAGFVAIRNKRPDVHRYLMVGAFASSSLFLVGYIAYHYVHGDTKFMAEGFVRTVYFAILITHVILSMGVVPMALLAFYFAFRRRFASHKKVTRLLLPIWLYVSVTGVVIFFLLRAYGAPAA